VEAGLASYVWTVSDIVQLIPKEFEIAAWFKRYNASQLQMERRIIPFCLFFAIVACLACRLPLVPQNKSRAEDRYSNAPIEESATTSGMAPQKGGEPSGTPHDSSAKEKESDSKRGSFDYLLWGFAINLFLAVATLVIAITAVVQAKAAKASAEAARLSALAFIEGQRPQFDARPHSDPAVTITDPGAPRVEMEIRNVGPTSAYDFIYETWIELLPSTAADFTEHATYFKCADASTIPAAGEGIVLNIPLQRELTPAEDRGLRKAEIYACLRIRVSYTDGFGDVGYANFGFFVRAKGLGKLSRYNDAGHRKKDSKPGGK
jgi:hypothetical protein